MLIRKCQSGSGESPKKNKLNKFKKHHFTLAPDPSRTVHTLDR